MHVEDWIASEQQVYLEAKKSSIIFLLWWLSRKNPEFMSSLGYIEK